MKLWLNGEMISKVDLWNNAYISENLKNKIKNGSNLIAVEANNTGGHAAYIFKLILKMEDGRTQEIVSDTSWKASEKLQANWNTQAPVSTQWSDELFTFGDLGIDPWGILI